MSMHEIIGFSPTGQTHPDSLGTQWKNYARPRVADSKLRESAPVTATSTTSVTCEVVALSDALPLRRRGIKGLLGAKPKPQTA